MQFQLQEDIEAPIDSVFAIVTDAELIERAGMRRGIHSQRNTPGEPMGVGTQWTVTFGFRGVERKAEVLLKEMDAPNVLVFENETDGLNVPVTIELIPLSRDSTRMKMSIDLVPQSLPARLLVQSVRLARGTLEKKLNNRMTAIARDIEARVSKAA